MIRRRQRMTVGKKDGQRNECSKLFFKFNVVLNKKANFCMTSLYYIYPDALRYLNNILLCIRKYLSKVPTYKYNNALRSNKIRLKTWKNRWM